MAPPRRGVLALLRKCSGLDVPAAHRLLLRRQESARTAIRQRVALPALALEEELVPQMSLMQVVRPGIDTSSTQEILVHLVALTLESLALPDRRASGPAAVQSAHLAEEAVPT